MKIYGFKRRKVFKKRLEIPVYFEYTFIFALSFYDLIYDIQMNCYVLETVVFLYWWNLFNISIVIVMFNNLIDKKVLVICHIKFRCIS